MKKDNDTERNPEMGVDPKRLPELRRVLPHKKRKGKGGSGDLDYIDARQAMDLLDEIVGAENWEREHDKDGWCTVRIFVNGRWVSKTDKGTQSTFEKEKGESSDSFKRACVNWGIGRFLYGDNRKATASQIKEMYRKASSDYGCDSEWVDKAIASKGWKKAHLSTNHLKALLKAAEKKSSK